MLFGFPFDSTVFSVFLVTAWTVAVNATVVSTATEAGSIRGAGIMSTVRNDDGNFNNFVRRRKLTPGSPNDDAWSFVVDAEDADSDAVDEHPYFAQLVVKDERYSYNCGGALITPHVILTAAHCTDGIVGVTEIGAYVGSRNYRSANAIEEIEYRTCAEFLVHPSYVPVRYDDDGFPVPGTGVTGGNDFALCKLDDPVHIDSMGSNVILFLDQGGDDENDLAGKIAHDHDEAPPPVTMMGFDRTTTSSSSSDPGGTGWTDVLQTVDLPLYHDNDDENENDKCDGYYGGVGIIDETMICAWDRTGEGAECFGNSGGPLVVKDGPEHTLLGISSFSASSSCGSSPSVFSRVSKAVDWVKANMAPPSPAS